MTAAIVDRTDAPRALDGRLHDAALRCFARWGVAKTTLDDVAREAGVSRATVYRSLPGGKEALIDSVSAGELSRFLDALASRIDGIDDLETLLVTGISEAGRALQEHAVLQFLLAHEPELVLPRLCFAEMDRILAVSGAFAAPYLAHWLSDEDARRAGEWITRLVLSYLLSPAEGFSFGDVPSVQRLVRTFVLPGVLSQTQAR